MSTVKQTKKKPCENEPAFMTDTQGRQVPTGMVKDIDKQRDATVRRIAARAVEMKGVLTEFKNQIRDDIYSFVEKSAGEYGVKFGGKKGNISLNTYDGQYRLLVSMNDNITFDERLQVAKELIGKCIEKWSDGARSEIRVLVNDAFQVDKTGKISTGRVLGLRRLDIQDKDWQKAMAAITESVQITGTKQYLRIYERDTNGEYQMIPLDVAAL
ncbi:MAG: DUF3164 family protein [Treponema sp.]|jgi:hypothetical protein|nr:DUF3164 family protein [Treponema sp.]